MSYTLSHRAGKPDRPPYVRMLLKSHRLSGQQLVGVALMAHVPHDDIARRFELRMKGDGQLDHAEARPEVAAVRARSSR